MGRLESGRALDYALGLTVIRHRGLRTIGHGGSLPGFKTHFMRYPEQDLGIVILANREDAVPYALAREIGAIVLADAMQPAAAPIADGARLAGTYVDKRTGFTLDVTYDRGAFRANFLGGEESLEPTPGGGLKQTGGHMGIELAPPSPGSGQPERWSGTIGWGLDVEWTPVQPYRPSANDLVPYLGRYQSAETGAVHQVAIREGQLAIRLGLGPRPEPWVICTPVMPDVFRFALAHMQWTSKPALRFLRGADGAIAALELSANRSRHLLFERLG